MPRFFFDFGDGDHRVTDDAGRHFGSEDDAVAVAVASFRRSIELGARLVTSRRYRMTVRNEMGETVFETEVTAKGVPLH